MKQEKWLIVGSGWISDRFCIDLIAEEQKIVGIWGIDRKQASNLAKKHGIENVYDDLNKIDIEYDNVYVAVPNAYHFDLSKRFVNLGKNVLVEKPFTHSYKTTKELFELGDANGVKVMEAYPHIFPGRFEEYRLKGRKLKVNFLNPISYIKGITSQYKVEAKGGAVADSGVYAISMAIWLNGPIERIIFNKILLHESGVDSYVSLTLHHENGSITDSNISITDSGDNGIYLDGKLLDKGVSRWVDGRMRDEIRTLLDGDFKFSREISLETAKVIDANFAEVERIRNK